MDQLQLAGKHVAFDWLFYIQTISYCVPRFEYNLLTLEYLSFIHIFQSINLWFVEIYLNLSRST